MPVPAEPLPVLTADSLVPADRPTYYFLGVSTGGSSIQRVFPLWARELGIDAVLRGIDLPIGAPLSEHRRVLEFVADDPLGVGMQITSHKTAVYEAARDRFDELGDLAQLMGEVSCVSKRDGRLHGFAKDPRAGALALDALVPPGHWRDSRAEALILGGGGAGTALTWCLVRDARGDDRPAALTVTDRDPTRFDHLHAVHERVDGAVPVRFAAPDESDALVAALPPGSLIVNATGLGKDLPGSPLGDGVRLPPRPFIWELNYRGELEFLEQAARSPDAVVQDGWTYFLHGWLQAIKEVFAVEVPVSGPAFEALSDLARTAR